MKKNFTIILLLLNISLAFSQAPQAVTYQAVATNASGLELISSPIGIRASVIQGVITNPAQYIETFHVTTDTFGLFTISVGQGTYFGGTLTSFAQINWGAGPFFLKIEMDASGGTNYATMGTNQMLSVPYALYALKCDTANFAMNADSVQYLSLHGDTLFLSRANYVIIVDTDSVGSNTYTPPINQPIPISYLGSVIYVCPFEFNDSVYWGAYNLSIPGAHSLTDGRSNTNAIVAALGNNSGIRYAAKVCDTLTAFGYNDWYLPSIRELEAIDKQSYLIPNYGIDSASAVINGRWPANYFYWSSTEVIWEAPNQIYTEYWGWGGSNVSASGSSPYELYDRFSTVQSVADIKIRCIRR